MYLPRSLISHLYLQLVKSHHPLSPPVLLLVALEPDALCACRILTALLKRDYIPHKIKPISGYADLTAAGNDLIRPMRYSDGGSGGVVVSLGVGGLVDLETILGLENGADGVDIWLLDARRPWNLGNVFSGVSAAQSEDQADGAVAPPKREVGVERGQLSRYFASGKGGIIVFDDGDIQHELSKERDAWFSLEAMPEVDADDHESDASSDSDEPGSHNSSSDSTPSRKRKTDVLDDVDVDTDDEKENEPPRQRRRSNSSSPIPSSPTHRYSKRQADNQLDLSSTPPSNQHMTLPPPEQPARTREPSAQTLRRRLVRLRRKHEAVLEAYHSLGTSYSEPISSLAYSLACELGREDNDLLWLAIVGITSAELSGRTSTGFSLTDHDTAARGETPFRGWSSTRGSRIRAVLRDEVRRLNPPPLSETGRDISMRGYATDSIPIHARSSNDNSIRLSPEPRFLLLRHWSLYDSMLHSPYLSAKLHIWSDGGRRRLHKLLAKMGVSLAQCRQNYTHMDMALKQLLRERLLQFAPQYGLDGLLPPAYAGGANIDREGWGFVKCWGWKACLSAADVATILAAVLEAGSHAPSISTSSGSAAQYSNSSSQQQQSQTALRAEDRANEALIRFYNAYDALLSPTKLLAAIPLAQSLARAILRTGSSLLQKRQIRHLRAFRMGVIKDGPDVGIFCNPGALTQLALWIGEAVAEMEGSKGEAAKRGGPTPLVLGCLDDARGVYVVVGLGGGLTGVSDAQDEKSATEQTARREARKAARETRRAERETRRAERAQRRRDNDDEDEEETESEGSDSSGSDSDSDDGESGAAMHADAGKGLNRFGHAFQEVIASSGARVRLDSFEHCVVEVRKEDLSGFLERLSFKAVIA